MTEYYIKRYVKMVSFSQNTWNFPFNIFKHDCLQVTENTESKTANGGVYCKGKFSSFTSMKTTHRKRLNAQADIKIQLSSITRLRKQDLEISVDLEIFNKSYKNVKSCNSAHGFCLEK